MAYTFIYNNQSYELKSSDCSFFMNDDEQPLLGVNVEKILEEMAQSDLVAFHKAYYDQACEACHKNRQEGSKYFDFLEFHFYLFAKEESYIMSSLSEAYEDQTLPDLIDEGIVDSSYIVSINVCEKCGDYTVDLEYGLW